MNKTDLEAANWNVAHTWAEGLGLEFSGIDLSDLTVYSLLMVLGRIQIAAAEQPPAALVSQLGQAGGRGREAPYLPAEAGLSHSETRR